MKKLKKKKKLAINMRNINYYNAENNLNFK